MKEKLMAIRATLNNVEVRGADNWNRLLGCVQTLNELIGLAETQEQIAGERTVSE